MHTLLMLLLAVVVIEAGLGAWEAKIRADNAYREQQQQTKSETEKIANEIADRCQVAFTSNPAFRKCLFEQIWAYQREDNANQDLKAQQDMALWGFWTVVVGALSLLIGFGGLIALYLSLRQTRTAIKDNREIGEAEVRAYLALKLENGTIDLGVGKKPTVEFKIFNFGNSPASKVRFAPLLEMISHPLLDNQGPLVLPPPWQTIPSVTVHQQMNITGDATTDMPFNEMDARDVLVGESRRLYIAVTIFYEDVFKKPRETYFCASAVVTKSTPTKVGVLYKIEWEQSDVLNHAT